ncbi:MAG: alpha/beta hydrolase [Actinobacteria bacterium]|nr:alpha/beta hydrolase [Actinomycetota bacterium]
MSTPPFVDLPEGSSVEFFSIRETRRAVMHAGMTRAVTSWCVLVPGFTGSKEDFIAVLPILAREGVGAVSFDQLGQYQSDGSSCPGDYDLSLLAADVIEVIEQASRRFGCATPPHLVGHSMGGLVAQQAILDAAPVASFTALCSGPGALPPDRHAGLIDLVAALGDIDLAQIWATMQEMDASAGVPAPPPPIADFLRHRWMANHPVALQQFARLLLDQPDLTPAMAAVLSHRPPATVIWGEYDDAWPIPTQVQMARAWGARAVQLDGLGHSPNADDPEALVAALLGGW